jgi:hypothetical protein
LQLIGNVFISQARETEKQWGCSSLPKSRSLLLGQRCPKCQNSKQQKRRHHPTDNILHVPSKGFNAYHCALSQYSMLLCKNIHKSIQVACQSIHCTALPLHPPSSHTQTLEPFRGVCNPTQTLHPPPSRIHNLTILGSHRERHRLQEGLRPWVQDQISVKGPL